jgi:threonine dehydrogenase-like Zn-dependent dehydrogenase
MLFPVPDAIPDEVAVFADPFAVSLHSITRHPPPPGRSPRPGAWTAPAR